MLNVTEFNSSHLVLHIFSSLVNTDRKVRGELCNFTEFWNFASLWHNLRHRHIQFSKLCPLFAYTFSRNFRKICQTWVCQGVWMDHNALKREGESCRCMFEMWIVEWLCLFVLSLLASVARSKSCDLLMSGKDVRSISVSIVNSILI